MSNDPRKTSLQVKYRKTSLQVIVGEKEKTFTKVISWGCFKKRLVYQAEELGYSPRVTVREKGDEGEEPNRRKDGGKEERKRKKKRKEKSRGNSRGCQLL